MEAIRNSYYIESTPETDMEYISFLLPRAIEGENKIPNSNRRRLKLGSVRVKVTGNERLSGTVEKSTTAGLVAVGKNCIWRRTHNWDSSSRCHFHCRLCATYSVGCGCQVASRA